MGTSSLPIVRRKSHFLSVAVSSLSSLTTLLLSTLLLILSQSALRICFSVVQTLTFLWAVHLWQLTRVYGVLWETQPQWLYGSSSGFSSKVWTKLDWVGVSAREAGRGQTQWHGSYVCLQIPHPPTDWEPLFTMRNSASCHSRLSASLHRYLTDFLSWLTFLSSTFHVFLWLVLYL